MTVYMGELFCGPGGMSLGARLAAQDLGLDLQHAWATDIDYDSCVTYWNNVAPVSIRQDVRKLEMYTLPRINGLAFGFPCNDYSDTGKQLGLLGDYGPLYSYGVRALEIKQPEWFVAENVSGMARANEGKAFERILAHLEEANYIVTPHLYSFDQYGVPQKRQRIIIVGTRKDLGITFTPPSTTPYAHLDVTAKHALTVPPIPETAPNHEIAPQSADVTERLSYIRPGEGAYTPRAFDAMPERLRIYTGAQISSTYRRLRPDQPSYTVTSSSGGGMAMYHWDEPRALTNRERARLQTFPDDFTFEGNRTSVRKQIGMAVPPQGARAIFTELFKTLYFS